VTNIAPLTRETTRGSIVLVDKGKDSLLDDWLNELIELLSEWEPLLKHCRESNVDLEEAGQGGGRGGIFLLI
jgi:hypothetical protein